MHKCIHKYVYNWKRTYTHAYTHTNIGPKMNSALSVLSIDIKDSARAEQFLSTYTQSIPEEGTYYVFMKK